MEFSRFLHIKAKSTTCKIARLLQNFSLDPQSIYSSLYFCIYHTLIYIYITVEKKKKTLNRCNITQVPPYISTINIHLHYTFLSTLPSGIYCRIHSHIGESKKIPSYIFLLHFLFFLHLLLPCTHLLLHNLSLSYADT